MLALTPNLDFSARQLAARQLAAYLRSVHALVNNDAKFFSCLTSVILDYHDGRPADEMAASIIENG